MVTARGAILIGGAALLWISGRALGVEELFIAASVAVVLPAFGALAVMLGTSTVSVRRSVDRVRLLHGQRATVTLELRNDSRFPMPVLLVHDRCDPTLLEPAPGGRRPRFVITGLGSGRTTTLRYSIVGATRGRHATGPLEVRVRDPFATVERARRYSGTTDVLVYPRVRRLSGHLPRPSRGGTDSHPQRRLINAGDEFYTMREYVTGDDLRHVHWPSTAHRQRLMVRQHELPFHPQATVFCDTRAAVHRGAGEASSFERSVSAAASLCWHLAQREYQLRLVTDADGRPTHPQPVHELLDRLAEMRASHGREVAPALLRLRMSGGEGVLVAIVAPPAGREAVTAHPDAQALLQAGRGFATRLALVVTPPGTHAVGRARELAELLRAARWRAAPWRSGEPLDQAWSSVLLPGTRGVLR